MTRIITVASGKGGVGKTSISLNLALQLARLGYRTCLFDADLGLANINILLGLYPRYSLEHVILNQRSLADVIIHDHEGIDIIPGSSGMERMADLEDAQVERLVRSFSSLSGYDFFFLDTSAGVSNHVISFCMASPEVILVITPEPTSLTDAYSLLKVLSLNGFNGKVKLVINQSKSATIAKHAYSKFQDVVKEHLGIETSALGIVVQDPHVSEAIKAQQPLISLYPDSGASKCIENIATRLVENQPDNVGTSSLDLFWKRCLKSLGKVGRRAADKGEVITDLLAEERQGGRARQRRPITEMTVAQPSQEMGRLEPVTAPLVNQLIDAVNTVSDEIRKLRVTMLDDTTRRTASTPAPAPTPRADATVGAVKTSIAGVLAKTVDRALNGFNVRRELTVPDNLWSVAIGEAELAQVVDDVVGYAARVTMSGRAVQVCAENVTVPVDGPLPLSPGRYGKITITDQGVGVPPDFLRGLLQVTTEPRTNIGLARACALIKQNNGHMSAESELEAGTAFSIYVPAL